MGDKFDGALAGGALAPTSTLDISEALQDLSLHETLVTEDESGKITLLCAVQNPYTGGLMVIAQPGCIDSFPMMEAIKLSQMTSMLNDTARCSKYSTAIASALKNRKGCRVLDIGSGTGLLAMLAAREGAEHVDAVEMFVPMAHLSEKVIRDNGYSKRIHVFPAKSTDLAVVNKGGEGHLEARADILVTEIFDSALLGEACLPVIEHARRCLLQKNASIIPAKAVLHGTLLHSRLVEKFHNLGSEFPLHRNESGPGCKGSPKGIPIHIDALKEGTDYDLLSDTFRIFEFDFCNIDKSVFDRTIGLQIMRTKLGKVSGILTWWELDLTGNGDVLYSTKPGDENWQDHWLPVVYPLPDNGRQTCDCGEISITAGHDQLSFWFALGNESLSKQPCICGFHALQGGPYRIHELSSKDRLYSLQSRIRSALDQVISERHPDMLDEPIRCVDVSDGSVGGILASRISLRQAVQVVSIEEDSELSSFLYTQISSQNQVHGNQISIEHNPLSAMIQRELAAQADPENKEWRGIDVIISEPYTRAMCAYPLSMLANLIIQRNVLACITCEHLAIVPGTAVVKAQVLRFADNTLQRAFGGVEEVEGLDHGCFAELYHDWPGDERISLPLFQYVHSKVSEEFVIHDVNLCTLDGETLTRKKTITIPLLVSNNIDAVALWVEYDQMAIDRLSRYEILWLGKDVKTQACSTNTLTLASVFDTDTGTFQVSVLPRM